MAEKFTESTVEEALVELVDGRVDGEMQGLVIARSEPAADQGQTR